MLSAYLYRTRKSLLKRPLKFVLLLLALAMSVFMIFFPTLMAGEEDAVVRNPNVVLGGVSLVLIVMFNFMFFSGVKSGVIGFSQSDVNFHMAGPFSPKFNLIILVEGIIATCAILLWVLSCQVAVLYQLFGVSSADVIAILCGSALTMIIGFLISSFIGAKFAEDEKKKRNFLIGLAVVDILYVGAFVLTCMNKYGSFDTFKALGFKGIMAEFGTSVFSQVYPVAGWISLIYAGIVKNSLVYLIVGIALIVLTFVAIYLLYSKSELDYYETAIAYAQKVADIKEARKAGVDTDTANINRKIKVGKESLKTGWGANAFATMHFLQNARASKLFFVNSLGLMYRLICAVYMFIMSRSAGEDMGPMYYTVMGLTMITLLNVVVYGGGKTVLEFNKPYIFMVPESASSKLFYCLLADLPEIIFDSVLCAAIIWYFAKVKIFIAVGVFVMMIVFDYLCELVALIELRICRGLGRFLLMFVRYVLVYAILLIAIIPAAIVYNIVGSLMAFVLTMAGCGVIIIAVLLLASANIIDRVEFNS
ncbi:MAG: putative ABC exporter domain-containing protein [Saccharofermentans sp.]|nr:putative ABC exporter domain-containing protein [Saccharofermentans sp.]